MLAVIVAGSGLSMLVAAAGCLRDETDDPPRTTVAEHSYTTRGRIAELPDGERAQSQLRILHEAVPDFRAWGGEVFVDTAGRRGMAAMEMHFPLLAEGVALADLAVGDPIEFDWTVRWQRSAPDTEPTAEWTITAIRPLPDDAELNFGPADPG